MVGLQVVSQPSQARKELNPLERLKFWGGVATHPRKGFLLRRETVRVLASMGLVYLPTN